MAGNSKVLGAKEKKEMWELGSLDPGRPGLSSVFSRHLDVRSRHSVCHCSHAGHHTLPQGTTTSGTGWTGDKGGRVG